MIIQKRLLLIILFSFLAIAGDAASEKKTARKANSLFHSGYFDKALPLYQKLHQANPNNFEYAYRTGLCYFNSNNAANRAKALPFFEASKKLMPEKIHAEVYYYLGQTYHLSNKFDAAIEAYNTLLPFIKPKGEGKIQIKEVERFIETCNNAKEIIKTPVQVKIDNIGSNINSEYPDYAPVISGNESVLIFTSKREGTTGRKKDEDGQYFEDIYISRKISDGGWKFSEKLDTFPENQKKSFFKILFSKAENIGNTVNTKTHDASIAISSDGKKLFIFRKNHIWMSANNGKKWGKA